MQLCGETPNKPPWKGAEDSGFFFQKRCTKASGSARSCSASPTAREGCEWDPQGAVTLHA